MTVLCNDKFCITLKSHSITVSMVNYLDNRFFGKYNPNNYLTESEMVAVSNSVEKRKMEFAAGRFALKTAYSEFLGIQTEFGNILSERLKNGKPVIPGSGLNVSISHDYGFAAAAVTAAKSGNIGIDIHCKAEFDGEIELFVNESEKKTEAFYGSRNNFLNCLWCFKESRAKFQGGGLELFEELSVRNTGYTENNLIYTEFYNDDSVSLLDTYGMYYFAITAEKKYKDEISEILIALRRYTRQFFGYM